MSRAAEAVQSEMKRGSQKKKQQDGRQAGPTPAVQRLGPWAGAPLQGPGGRGGDQSSGVWFRAWLDSRGAPTVPGGIRGAGELENPI